MKNWDNVVLVPEFDEQGVACYRLEGGDYENEYYVISEAESRKLLNTPEIVGYEVYNCLVSSTSQMLYYLKEQKKVTLYSMITSIIRQLVFLVPIAYVLARYGQSIGNDDLVWWCYPIAEIASLGVTMLFFLRVYRTVIAKVPLDGAPSLEEQELEAEQ